MGNVGLGMPMAWPLMRFYWCTSAPFCSCGAHYGVPLACRTPLKYSRLTLHSLNCLVLKSPKLHEDAALDFCPARLFPSQLTINLLPHIMALQLLLLTLSFLYCKTSAISRQGNVGLWSDSECNSKSGDTSNFGEQDPIDLNFTLLPDVCGVSGATVHSYRVSQSATCANGTTATFDYYDSNNCTADPTDEDPNPGSAKRVKSRRDGVGLSDGECLALIAFNSLAFICEGVVPQNKKVISLSTSTVAPKTASSSIIPSVASVITSTSSSNLSDTAAGSSARNSPTTSSLGSKSGLSAGTSAGVGVGSAIGVLGIAALCFTYFQKQRAAKNETGRGRLSANPAMTSASDRGGIAYEAGGSVVHEAGGDGLPYEIGGVAIHNVHEAGTYNDIHEMASPRMNTGL